MLLDHSFSVECFVDRCLSLYPFYGGHCVVCPSSINGFWLPFEIFKLFSSWLFSKWDEWFIIQFDKMIIKSPHFGDWQHYKWWVTIYFHILSEQNVLQFMVISTIVLLFSLICVDLRKKKHMQTVMVDSITNSQYEQSFCQNFSYKRRNFNETRRWESRSRSATDTQRK